MALSRRLTASLAIRIAQWSRVGLCLISDLTSSYPRLSRLTRRLRTASTRPEIDQYNNHIDAHNEHTKRALCLIWLSYDVCISVTYAAMLHNTNKAIRDGRPRPPRHQGFIAISYGGSELRHRSILETITHRPKCQIQKL